MRYVLLDRITSLNPPESATGTKAVSLSDDLFADHFPGYPILPGALIIEAMAQLAGVLLEATLRGRGSDNLHAVLVGVNKAKFRRQVRPGCCMELRATTLTASEDGGQLRVNAEVDGARVAEAELSFALTAVDHPELIARRKEYLDIWLHGAAR